MATRTRPPLAEFVIDSGPDRDVVELLRGPAGAATMDDLRPPVRAWQPPYVNEGEPEDAEDEGERRPARTFVSEAALRVLEAAVHGSKDQPRWPKGTPGGKGGQFMRVGETFVSGGKTYQIAHIVKGRVYAHEASGKYSQVETKAFDVADVGGEKTVKDVEYKAPAVPKGGKSQSANITVVEPYVDSSTHDPSIPIPEGSALSPEQWQRFGKVDQEHYAELMERFGKHKPGAAKQHVDAAYEAFQAKVQQMVKSGYSSQYGSSSGYSLSLLEQVTETPEMAKLREEALALQAEHKAAVQWDLYNRTLSPDLFAVHKSKDWSAQQWHDHAVKGNNKVFSGLSQSWSYRAQFFGKHAIATPLAIRHVLLSSYSAQPIPGQSHFPGELEISVPEQMKLDSRSITFSVPGVPSGGSDAYQLTATQNQWLEGVTNQPMSGEIMDMLRDSLDHGTKLPTPPAPPNITMNSAGGQTWADPPSAATKVLPSEKLPTVQSNNIDPGSLDKTLPWQHTDENGVPVAKTGEEAGAKAGQYFMGMKGTLYWIGNDPGNTSGYPFRIHKIENGAFNGENFAYNADLPGYYLDAHHEEVLVKPEDAPTFNPAEWVNGTETAFLEDFEQGDKFKLNGATYEVTGPETIGGVPIVDLESGLAGKINGNYKSAKLVPAGSAEAAGPLASEQPLSVGMAVMTPDGHGTVAAIDGGNVTVDMTHGGYQMDWPQAQVSAWAQAFGPQVGMTFPYNVGPGEFKKATVTVVKADGDVQVNLNPGKVVIPADEWAAYADKAFDPTAWNISADKTKLRDMKPGDKFQGSQGHQTIRPYEVLAVPPNGPVTVRNMDTGKVTSMSRHVSFRQLEAKPAPGSAAEGQQDTPDAPAASPSTPVSTDLAENIDPANLQKSAAKVDPFEWTVGTVIGSQDAPGSVVVGHETDDLGVTTKLVFKNLTGGHVATFEGDELDVLSPQHVWTPKGERAEGDLTNGPPPAAAQEKPYITIDGSKFTEGPSMKTGEMAPGTVYYTGGKGGKPKKFYKVSDDGEYAVSMTSGKSWPLKKGWKVTSLEPASDEGAAPTTGPIDPATFNVDDWENAGGSLLVADVPPGTVFANANGDVFQSQGQSEVYPDSLNAKLLYSETVPGGVGTVLPLNGNASAFPLKQTEAGGPGELPDPATHVYSAGEPLFLPNGEPIEKGKAYKSGYMTVFPVGSGNAPGSVQVSYEDGSQGPVMPSELEPYAPAPTVGIAPASLKGKPGALFMHKGATMSVAADQSLAQNDELIAIAPDGGGWLVTPDSGGVTPVPGKGVTKQLKAGDAVVWQGQHGTVTQINLNESAENPGGSVVLNLADGSTTTALAGELEELPSSANLKPGDLVHVFKPADPLNPSLGGDKHAVGHVKQVLPSGQVQIEGSLFNYAPENVSSLEAYPFKPGDKVQHSNGVSKGMFVGWDVIEGTPWAAYVNSDGDENHALPDDLSLASAPVEDPVATVAEPKGATELSYDDLGPGDATTLEKLKQGDHYHGISLSGEFVGGNTWVVIEPPGTANENGKVQLIGPDGEPKGMVYDLYPAAPVQLVAKAADVAAQPAPVEHVVDVDALPDASDHGFVGFKSHKGSGGKWSHHQVKSMPEGTVFADLNGKQWKVKQAGAQPVITDGESLFKVSGTLRGKDLNQPAVKQNASLVDNSPPVGWQPAEPAMVDNTLSFAELGLEPGDQFKMTPGGKLWTATGVAGDSDGLEGLSSSGTEGWFPMGDSPSHVAAAVMAKTVPAPAPPEATPAPAAAPTLHTAPTTAGDLDVGDTFTFAPGSGTVYTVTFKNQNGISYQSPELAASGNDAQMGPGVTLYTEPGAPETAPLSAALSGMPVGDTQTFDGVQVYKSSQGFNVTGGASGTSFYPDANSAAAGVEAKGGGLGVPAEVTQPVDPASVETIDSPDDLVAVPPVEADPVPTPAPQPLQAFGSRLGPGGVYKHDKLSELQVGQLFTDKSGADYQLVSHGEGVAYYKNVATGAVHEAKNDLRVKRTALPPDPGPQVKQVLETLEATYGGLGGVPSATPEGFTSATGEGGKVKYPRLGHLAFGDTVVDALGNKHQVIASWLDKSLVFSSGAGGGYRVVPAATRVKKLT